MTRRNFTKTAMTALVGAATVSTASAQTIGEKAPAFKSKFAPNLGQFRATCKGMKIDDKLRFLYDCGYRALEDNGMPNRPREEQDLIAKTMEKLGMEMGVFVAHAEWGNAAMTGHRLDMKKRQRDKKAAIEYWDNKMKNVCELAKRVNAKWCTVVPGLEDPSLEPEYQFANVAEHLKRICEVLEKNNGPVIVLEPLNIRDHASLWLKRIPQAYALCKAVGSKHCKILDDLYHQQITEGNLIPNLDAAWDEIAYIQVGDNPGRKEPTTGEINYKNVFQHLWDKGYRGIIGMEHGQSDRTLEGDKKLLNAYRSVDVA